MTKRECFIEIVTNAVGISWDEGIPFVEAVTKAFWQWRREQIGQDTYTTTLGLDIVCAIQEHFPNVIL